MHILMLFVLLSLVSGAGLMLGIQRKLSLALLAFSCLLLTAPASAQEVIHVRIGQVTSVNPTGKTLTIKATDGSTILFRDVATPEPALSFAKAVRDKTVPVASFSKLGESVAVFYFGFDRPTAVAIKDLGAEAPKRSIGTVASFDHHQHSLTLKTETTEPQKVMLTEDTIVDTDNGVVKLSDYKPSKGERLRCLTKSQSEVALLVAPQ